MTLLKLIAELTEAVACDPRLGTADIDLDHTMIGFEYGEVMTFTDDDEDYYNDDVDESFYDPYMGCDSFDL